MIHSVDKALTLLEAVAGQDDWIGVRELARLTGLKAPTAQQLLKTLQARRFLEFDADTRRYRLGLAAALLGRAADLVARLDGFARPHVRTLFREFGETTVALACDRGAFQCVCACPCDKELATSVPSPADLASPHLMASGLALLAWQDAAFLDAYRKAHGLADAAFAKRLDTVRKAGFAEALDDHHSGVAAYGAPVVDAAGRAILSLGLSVPLPRFKAALGKQIAGRIVAAAQAMSRTLQESAP